MVQKNKEPKRKILKWTGIALLVPVVLFVLIALLFYFPPFQNWAVNKVASYASEKTGLEISVGHVNLEFPLDLSVEDIKVIQQNDSLPQVKDTVADIGKVVAKIQFLPLLKQQVEIDELTFTNMKVNTTNLIHEARVKGTLGSLRLISHGIDLSKELVKLNNVALANAVVNVELSDTVPPDTTTSDNKWKIYADKLSISNADVTVHMPGDTLQLQAYMGKADVDNGYFDLYESVYKIGKLNWTQGKLKYDNNFEGRTKGLDYNHVEMTDITLGADSLYYCDPKLNLNLRACSFKEKSGIIVNELSTQIVMDSTTVKLPSIRFKTPESSLIANYEMNLDAFADKNPGSLKAVAHGSFGKQDLMRFMGDMPSEFRKRWPNHPLTVDGVLKGNLNRVNFSGLSVKLPTAFTAHANGYITNPTDIKRIKADIDINARTYNLSFLTAMLDKEMMKTVRVPSGITMIGNIGINGSKYMADVVARESNGNVKLKGAFDINRMAYDATIKANNLQLHHFLPGMGLHAFTGNVDVNGVGTDILSRKTRLNAKASVTKFQYDTYNLDNMTAVATIQNGVAKVNVNSKNPLLYGIINVDALTSSKSLNATLSCDLTKADLYNLHLTDEPLVASLCGHVDVASDMKEHFQVLGLISDITIHDKSTIYRPEDVVLDILTRRDTTHAVVDCGDFHLNMDASGGYKRLLKEGNSLLSEAQHQMKARIINQVSLRQRLPSGRIYLSCGKDNFFSRVAGRYGCHVKDLYMNMTSSPSVGLNGEMRIDSLVASDIRLDTIRLSLDSSAGEMTYKGQIRNNKRNPQYVFNALFNGSINEKGTYVSAKLYDEKDKLGIDMGLAAEMEQGGIRAKFIDNNPILGYKKFAVNEDNFVFFSNDQRLSARMELKADDGTGVHIYTDDNNTEALQDLTVSLNRFDLENVLSLVPYTPNISGMMNGDFHVIQTKKELSISSSVSVDNMAYENCKMGDVSTEFVYMPKSDGSHYIDGILLSNDNEVADIKGTYDAKGLLDAKVSMNHMPLSMANGFVPEKIVGLRGYGDGELTVKGTLDKPRVNGEVYMDSSYIFSEPYGVEMRFANDPVKIVGSHVVFENFEMFSNNDSPLNVSGDFDFSDMNKMMLNVRMRAQNFELIDAKENPRSEAYGKAFVNFFGTMRGPVDNLQMRGKLDVLGTTDMTYVLRDSELSTDTQLDELVKFTNFKDTTAIKITRPPLVGFDMDLNMSIDESARILCMLNADHSNYIDLLGGGNLRMRYNAMDEIILTGKYTLNSGEMKYSLPVIPLKTFNIQNGSDIEFTGDPMDPKLNITATENVKANVNEGTGSGRAVDFTCGVKLTQTLNKPGIQFIITSPSDMSIQDELNTMTVEEQGKVAITMLVSGMYLTDGNTSSFSMNSALSSFLQAEINNIAGKAMRSMGLDIGMSVDNSISSTGAMHTDYNFKFSKRLWNNRLNVIVGGKVSTGTEIENRDNSFFDNVEFEYRLDKKSSKYLRLFYNNNTYDWLEGMIGEYGAGFMWRRKIQHFRDIFRFNADKDPIMPMQVIKKDSLNNENK